MPTSSVHAVLVCCRINRLGHIGPVTGKGQPLPPRCCLRRPAQRWQQLCRIGAGENIVSGLAAELLGYALDVVVGTLLDLDADFA